MNKILMLAAATATLATYWLFGLMAAIVVPTAALALWWWAEEK